MHGATRSFVLAALGAAGVVAVCVATAGIAIAAVSPSGSERAASDVRIPSDLVWTWVAVCEAATAAEPAGTGGGFSFTTDVDGIITAEMGDIDENGFFHVDEVRSAQMNACLSTRRAENFGGVTYGNPSDAQGLALYDWAVRNQQPCLASRGMETVVPPLEQFVDEQYVPWYLLDQYIWGDGGQLSDLDFDALLEARFACPPAPAYLVEAATW